MTYDYEDDEILMTLPDYLRAEGGLRAFKPFGREQKARQIFTLAVELVADRSFADAIRDAMSATKALDWMGVQTRIIRKGPTAHTVGGYECLSASHNSINGEDVHSYNAIYPAGPVFVRFAAGGRGDFESFEAACEEIRASIRLKDSELSGA